MLRSAASSRAASSAISKSSTPARFFRPVSSSQLRRSTVGVVVTTATTTDSTAAPRSGRAAAARATMPPRVAAAASNTAQDASPKRVLVPVADGSEEMEVVIVVDVLRRAGASVTVASAEADGRLAVTCSRGVLLTADATLDAALGAVSPFDLIVVPGGMPGAERLAGNAALTAALRAQREAGRPVAAICAAPAVVLEAQGLLPAGQPATAHPAFSGKLANQASVDERVAVATGSGGLVVTSRGPGTAFEFALALVALLCGEAKAREVAGPMVMQQGWEDSVRKVLLGA